MMTRFLRFTLLALLLFQATLLRAGEPNLVLLCLAAHPDDEDGATLAYYAKLRGVKTYSLYYTRGEGGQNEISSALGEELGRLRERETREAASVIGSEVYFLGFEDFGFSKTARETFAKWGGREKVVEKLVSYIRALKPDVIISRHDTVTTKPNRQHGNHQAVGLSVYEAFEKAADPLYHPEQPPWQVKKLFLRPTEDTTRMVVLDMSQRDSAGRTIAEIAQRALAKHRSQGAEFFGANFSTRRFVLLRSDRDYPFDPHDLLSGLSPSSREPASVSSTPTTPSMPRPPQTARATLARHVSIGIVATYDSTLEQTLHARDVPFSLLDSASLAAGELSRFTTIVVDLRGFNSRTDAARYHDRLLAYALRGGNVVCFYHKPGDWNGKGYAPFPITLTSERVTEEDAPVRILLPAHPLLNRPNRITEADWAGWVQERNIYLPSDDTAKTSGAYERLLATSDADETQPPTSLLWCRTGKGTYTYVSLALYRQLRIGHEGAVKLLLNLLSQ